VRAARAGAGFRFALACASAPDATSSEASKLPMPTRSADGGATAPEP
jgi:hypothetical protein